ncbi:MAG: Sir2 family NAD-dependent protein deacetylase [Pirellulales bacterium]|nr:Sir2 family NAD-dependent protein deacetylase [Pirellulales bacterium]
MNNDTSQTSAIRQIAAWLGAAKHGIAFTGAGISTESGIPDFRSPGGVWAKNRQVEYQEFLESAEARHEYWRQKCEAHVEFAASSPNVGHQVLARWEQSWRIRGLITQNIDGLHQLAGNHDVLELHGTARRVRCLDCQAEFDVEPLVQQFRSENVVPSCTACEHGRLKHATVSFGQSLPADTLQQAAQWARQADVFLALGSSLVVYPAAELPRLAKQHGAKLVIINRDPTPFDDLADIRLETPLGETLAAIDKAIQDNV